LIAPCPASAQEKTENNKLVSASVYGAAQVRCNSLQVPWGTESPKANIKHRTIDDEVLVQKHSTPTCITLDAYET
jgi:hypothetical protein